MAQNITLLGANYPDVPSVNLPKTGGGTASFVDVTDTTADASDVASGKYFYASDGTKTLGTASGGGGQTTLKLGVLRPDAELVQSYSFDQYAVEDMELTIPAYTTTATTLKASEALTPKVALDLDTYKYYVLVRALTIPIYNVTSKAKGREEYHVLENLYEIVEIPANEITAIIDPTKAVASRQQTVTTAGGFNRLVYYSSGTVLAAQSTSYGVYQTLQAPSYSNPNLTLNAPSLNIRGSTSYFTSTYMNATTDIRVQYKIEVYRSQKGALNLDGWGIFQQFDHILDCVKNNNGTLT